jgi:G3E family GTPase
LIVVSGMVGSGKTTFINHLLKERGSLRLGIVQHTLSRREIPGAPTAHAKLKGPKSGTEVQVVEVMIEHEEAAAAPCLDEAYLEEVFELAQDPGLRAIIIEPTGGCRPQEVVQGFLVDYLTL